MSDGADSSEFELAKSTSHLLHRAQQLASDRFALLVGENGVTLRQFAVLSAIHEAPGLNQTELVRATGIDRSTLADMIVRMEKRGWVLRTASNSDARANAVSLAPAGAAVRLGAVQHAKAADAAILDALHGNKREAFKKTLVKLSQVSDEAAEKAKKKAEKELRKAARRKARLDVRERERAERERRRREAKKDAESKTKKKHKRAAMAPAQAGVQAKAKPGKSNAVASESKIEAKIEGKGDARAERKKKAKTERPAPDAPHQKG